MALQNHQQLITPNNEQVFWHYIAFDKLISILLNRRIVMRSLAGFEDKFEGKIPASMRRDFRFPDNLLPREGQTFDEYQTSIPGDLEERSLILDEIASYMNLVNQRYLTFIHCWFAQEHESILMWKSYAPGSSSCAIKTNFQRLKQSLSNCRDPEFIPSTQNGSDTLAREFSIFHSLVRYIDYDDPGADGFQRGQTFWLHMHKRHEYRHENEFRLIYSDFFSGKNLNPNRSGDLTRKRNLVFIENIEVSSLVEEIVVSPYSVTGYEAHIRELISAVGLDIPVRRSTIII